MNVFRVVLFVVILVTAGLFALLIFYPLCAYAANITVTGSTWPIGLVGAGAEDTSSANAWIITNTSAGIEDIDIRVSSTGNWSASDSGTSGSNEFGLKVGTSGGMIITAEDKTLTTDLLSTYDLGLWFKAPSDGSDEGPHTLTVTLSATNWRQATVIYMATASTNGNIGGRSGADAFCTTNKPINLPSAWSNIHAFLSVDEEDEARDMPALYGYVSNYPLYFWNSSTQTLTKFANNWPDMFDESILVLPGTGLGIETWPKPWTGTTGTVAKPGVHHWSCFGWTDGSDATLGTVGANSLTASWLYYPGNMTDCDITRPIYCICSGVINP